MQLQTRYIVFLLLLDIFNLLRPYLLLHPYSSWPVGATAAPTSSRVRHPQAPLDLGRD